MSNAIKSLLGIKYPIIQGGMAWVADASLAASVSEAGGLGLIGAGNAPADFVKEQIKKAKSLTDKPFGVNIMLLSPFVDEVAEVVVAEGVKVVTTGAGNPAKYISKWKDAGIKVISVVASVALAKMMQKAGVDAVVAEGMEAGGHIGKLTTMSLVPQVVDAVTIPVIGAGGVADGRGMAAMLALGADGVQMGTRFLVSKDCTIHENYKKLILKAKDIDTTVTGNFTGHPVRVLRNPMSKKLLELEENGISIEEFERFGAGTLRKAAVEGDTKEGSFMSGQIAGLVTKEQTSKEIINEIISEYNLLIGEFMKL